MGFMWAALDESSDRERKHIFVVAGYLARQENWTEIERKWLLRLEKELEPRPMRYFSSSECMHLTGEFARFKDQTKYPKPKGRSAANKIREDLQDILKNGPAAGFALGMFLKDFRAVRKSADARRMLGSDPYEETYLMMMIVIAGELEDEFLAGRTKVRETVAYLCDEHDKSVNIKAVYDELKIQNPNCGQWMGSISYMDNEQSPALQAADLLASQCKDVLVEQATKVDERKLRDTFKARVGGNVTVRFMDKKLLKDLIRANVLKKGKPSIYSTQQLSLKALLIDKNDK